MKRLIAMLLALSMLINLTGCEAVAKKFRRKKKEVVKMPRMFQTQEYEKKPSAELYKKHYSYWEAWQSELITVAGENRKKDRLCIEQIISNLKDMQNILVSEKAEMLKRHIDNLEGIRDTIDRGDLTQYNKDTVIHTLEREDRSIKREFCYSKVRNSLRTTFNDEESGDKAK